MNVLKDFIDFLLDDSGYTATQGDLRRTRAAVERELRKAGKNDQNLLTIISALAQQNRELRVRVGVLIRLLVEKGIISPEELATEVQETKQSVLALQVDSEAAPPTKRKKLPKPPRKLGTPSDSATPDIIP